MTQRCASNDLAVAQQCFSGDSAVFQAGRDDGTMEESGKGSI